MFGCEFGLAQVRLDSKQTLTTAPAQSRETERSLLNLLGLLAKHSADDQRIGHLRAIWLKQMRMVSNEGGIVLRIFYIRVTYVNVLQVSEPPASRATRSNHFINLAPPSFVQTIIFTASLVALTSH